MQSIQMAFKSIMGNKMRSFLTMLGIIIGVVAVVVLVSIGQGANQSVSESIQKMGTNLLSVNINMRRNNPINLDRVNEMRRLEGVAQASPVSNSSGTLKAGLNQYEDGSIIATTPGYDVIRNYSLKYGRFITEPDVNNRSFVAVLGQEAAEELFGSLNVVGESFTWKGYPFTVVGVLNEIGTSMIGSGDNLIIIPYTVGERLFQRKGISSVYVSAMSADNVSIAQESLTSYMDRLMVGAYSSTKYNIYNQTTALKTLNTATNTLTLMLGGIAAISLLVGGIGIMNIMLVSVSERTREIGIRKAIGATRRNILSQFLVEALVLSLIGGLIGLGISVLATRLLEPALEMTLNISPSIAALSVGFSLSIGVIFGLYPANKASKLLPVIALRHE
ncbi:MAG: FtsX-like permease family protein [Christensenellaceae bacterium]|nr:FtsX-like permease family protein [Christensenellaceae bacterium]